MINPFVILELFSRHTKVLGSALQTFDDVLVFQYILLFLNTKYQFLSVQMLRIFLISKKVKPVFVLSILIKSKSF